mmetsp:Transcript_10392/g.22483  ORF Transcript_10392/g.22483 Transcript_10392/m.22483 type:complete len:315 (-) Transcript_10392:82-1026(-)|eukprot:CAMPEP_0183704172 /NCGR_PEP_ID=MMETSP0737-20130205/1598_1 /TAXON_ID=385413 /ORGANISM="Thalassiosira miniscula, Strain CCMP1093" /LENGTH=314 /DNA_ID=CAMNT_0025930993 /DNA_START=58 /DNA_END=1002 /DNA_ORIENTATION=-
MIVEFAHYRRKSSDGSHPPKVAPKGRTQRATGGTNMIVEFAEYRRKSSDSSCSRRVFRRSERRVDKTSSPENNRANASNNDIGKRLTRGESSRDPIAMSWRQVDTPRQARSGRKKNEEKTISSTERSRPGVIVEFPERNPRSQSRRKTDALGLSGMFKKQAMQREPGTDVRRSKSLREFKKSNSPTRNHRGSHSRQFEESFDWRNSSIDWGDEEDDDETDTIANDNIDKYGKPKSNVDPSVQRRRSAEELAESFSQSLTSLLSARKLDNKRNQKLDKIHRRSETSERTAEFADSVSSSLSQSFTSLLTVRKLDP